MTRFTPIAAPGGATLPYMYLGDTDDVAIAETVLHDVGGRRPIVLGTRLADFALSALQLTREIEVIDLTGYGLTRIGHSQASLIASPPSRYPRTSAIAARLLDTVPTAAGILYPSRMFASGRCLVLYQRDRRRAPLKRISTVACGAGVGRERVDEACSVAGVTVVR